MVSTAVGRGASGSPKGRNRYLVVLIAVAIVVSLVGVALAYVYYDGQRTYIQSQVQANLSSVASLKVDEIVRWRTTALAHAEYMHVRTIGRTDVPLWLAGSDPGAAERIRQLLEDNAKYRGFDRVVLYEPITGRSVASDGTTATAHDVAAAKAALEASSAAIQQPYREGSGVYIDVTTPMTYADGTRVALLMRMDLRAFLYPLIQSWPVPSATAETLLVRRDGDYVVYLNDLRFMEDAALRQRYPMSESALPAVKAVMGQRGVTTGIDYRGRAVLAALEGIEGSDWALVAKMDESEVYGPIQQAGVLALAGVTALLLIFGAGIVAAWRIQVAGTLRDRALLAERYAFLSRNSNDVVILLDAGLRITEVNERAVERYGYGRDELLGMPLAQLRSPATRITVEEEFELLRESGGSRLYETEHVRKDGSVVPVEVSARVQDDAGTITFVETVRDVSERKAAEAARRELEEKYRYVFEHSSVPKSLTKPTGEIDVNDAFLDMVGYTREEIAEHGTWQQLSHPDDIESTSKHVAELISGEHSTARFEKRYLRKDGSIVWADLSTTLRRHADGEPDYFMTTLIDITEKKAALEKLAASERSLAQLFDNMSQGFAVHEMILDGSGAPIDYRFLSVNPAFEAMTGLLAQDIIGRTVLDVMPGTEHAWIERYGAVVTSGKPDLIEQYAAALDRYYEVVAYSPAPGRFATIISDVTARKAAEEELEAYRQHLEALVEERTTELASLNEKLTSSNEELASTNEELAATNEEMVALNEELAASGDETRALNEELASTNEELASVNQELTVTNEELQAATTAKSEFLANMSHELRTPLNSIIGFAGVMLQGLTGELTDEQRGQLTMIRRSGERLLALISDILDLSRIESGRAAVKPSGFSLDDLVASAVGIVQPMADEHRIELRVIAQRDGVLLRTDEQKVHQVLVNLLANAVKFTDHGSVSLEVSTPSESTVVFKVKDTGVGIAPEDLAEIFDEFVQLPRDGAKPEGTGLGLAISRRLAMILGGTLTASSVVGEGSTFALVLPRDYRDPGDAGTGRASGQG